MNRLRTYWSERSGAAAIEFAIVGPVFILLALGIVDIGRNLVIVHQLNHLADQISRALILDTDMDPAYLQAYVQANWQGPSPQSLVLTYNSQIVNGLQLSDYELSFPITWIVPIGGSSTLRVQRFITTR
jgi:Flp pilus assembly protein TadG